MPGFIDLIAATAGAEMERQTPTDLVYGTVTSVSPLAVYIDDKFTVDASKLILSALCKPFVTNAFRHKHKDSISGDTDEQLLTVTVWRGLAMGDRVRMLRCNGGQKYYIFEREGSFP